jgi:hypothetical protein
MYIFGTDLDLNRNEAKNFRMENGIALPSVVVGDSGLTFYHSGLEKFYGWTGSEWIDFGATGGGGSYTLPTATTLVLGGVKIDGDTINIDAGGVISASTSIIASGLEAIDEGNGIGWRLIGRDASKSGVIGAGSIDFQDNSSYAGTTYGPTSPGGLVFGGGNLMPINGTNFGAHIALGFENTVEGYYGNIAIGTYNVVTNGYNAIALGYAHNINMSATAGQGLASGTRNSLSSYWASAIGTGLISKSIGTLAVGVSNTDYAETGGDRPMLIVGNGTASTSTNPTVFGTRITSSDAFMVRYNGIVEATSLTTVLIDSESTGRVLLTREWYEAKSNINKIKATLSAAQVNALGTTPVELIAAAGVGTIIKVVSGVARINFGTVAFDDNVLNIVDGGFGAGGGFLNATSTLIESLQTDGGYQLTDNGAITASGTDSVAVGDGTVDIYLTYEIITL